MAQVNGTGSSDTNANGAPAHHRAPRERDTWYYPPDIAHDLDGIPLPQHIKGEIFACAWEYTRTVIPHYTNWSRYVAFMRIIVMGIIAEFKGDLLDVTQGDKVLNYSLDGILADLFAGTPGHAAMAREYKTFLLVSGDKSSNRCEGEFFRRYVNNLAHSPERYFRMRDTDALCRFTIAVALACSDKDDVWFTDEQFNLLAEIGDTMYDAVSFFKHRAEGETNSTFAYMPADLRVGAFRQCREVLWALDAAWCKRPETQYVTSFLRYFGGPLHMMMRRYRFVEENMTIGREEDVSVVAQTRNHYKLWNRIDASKTVNKAEMERYQGILDNKGTLLFPGLGRFIEQDGDGTCGDCLYRSSYGADTHGQFGGVQLCERCKSYWREYMLSFPERAAKVFPELVETYNRAISNVELADNKTESKDEAKTKPQKEEHDVIMNGSNEVKPIEKTTDAPAVQLPSMSAAREVEPSFATPSRIPVAA